MSRTRFAGSILRPLCLKSILDVGCRDGDLADEIPDVDYSGADLVPGKRVKFVGDITKSEIPHTFDAVAALDILEHVENPSSLFDRLEAKAERYIITSLPNVYDLKSRFSFAAKGRLGGKYVFVEPHPLDRHRWLMNRQEIYDFFDAKAHQHNLRIRYFDMAYGTSGRFYARLLGAALPKSLKVETVFALFER